MKKIIMVLLLIAFVSPALVFSQDFTDGTKYMGINDKDNNGDSVVNVATTTEKVGKKKYFTATMTGKVTTKYQYGYIIMQIMPTEEELARLQAGKGFKFKCTGDGKKYRIKPTTSNIKDYDYYGHIFTTDSKAKEVVVLYNKLSQEGWGAKQSFKKDKIVEIQIQTLGQPIPSVEIKVFDFEIID